MYACMYGKRKKKILQKPITFYKTLQDSKFVLAPLFYEEANKESRLKAKWEKYKKKKKKLRDQGKGIVPEEEESKKRKRRRKNC